MTGEDLIIHIIHCDLKHTKLLYDLQDHKLMDHHKFLNLHQAVVWLFRISEPKLCESYSTFYLKKITHFQKLNKCTTSKALHTYANEIFSALYERAQRAYTVKRQNRYAIQSHNPPFDIENVIVHIIKNDLIHARLVHEIRDTRYNRIALEFTLDRVIFWLLAAWQEPMQEELRSYYNGLKAEMNERGDMKKINDLTPLATEIYELLLEKSPLSHQ